MWITQIALINEPLIVNADYWDYTDYADYNAELTQIIGITPVK